MNGKAKEHRGGQLREKVMQVVFLIAACISILAVALICIYLFANSIPAISEVGLGNFLGGMKWAPNNQPAQFGIFPMIIGSIYVTAGAIIVGVPLGLLAAIYMAKFCPAPLYKILKPAVDLLAARELLRRQPDKADRRVIHLALTDAGAALAREGQKLQSTCLDALFAGLTQSEAERFQELLEKVLTSAEVRLKEGGNT